MSLKDQLRKRLEGKKFEGSAGFHFLEPSVVHCDEQQGVDAFATLVKASSSGMAQVDAKCLRAVGADGRIGGTPYRLSEAAFNDLCNFANVPIKFIKRLAVYDEQMALDVMETLIARSFHGKNAPAKELVIDVPHNRVDGIVGAGTYAPLSNETALDYVMSAVPDLTMTHGWLRGPEMRATVVSKKECSVKVGDIVRVGVDVQNATNGDRACRVADYNERLKCTNGMTARENGHVAHVIHRGDVEFNVQKAVVSAATHAQLLIPLMKAAAAYELREEDVPKIKRYVSSPDVNGSPKLFRAVAEHAMNEATEDKTGITLWHMVNGVTEESKKAPSLERRVKIEALGFATLKKFGIPLVSASDASVVI